MSTAGESAAMAARTRVPLDVARIAERPARSRRENSEGEFP